MGFLGDIGGRPTIAPINFLPQRATAPLSGNGPQEGAAWQTAPQHLHAGRLPEWTDDPPSASKSNNREGYE